jgi:ZIP family zinc transporter
MESSLLTAFWAGVITTLATGIGGLPFVFVRSIPERLAHLAWAVAGGMMLAASVFNLIFPGIEDGGIGIVAAGMLSGAFLFGLASRWIAQHDFTISGVSGPGGNRIALVLGTMFFHSFPEGLAVGVAFGSGEADLGIIITIAIAIHNIPEGIAVSLPLRAEGVSGWKCVMWSIISSLPQPFAVIPAYLAVVFFRPILPFAFGFAAGAMFFLVLSEMIPESLTSHVKRQTSALAGMFGFIAMMLIQNFFFR